MTTRLHLIWHASTTAVRAADFPADEPLDDHGLRKLALFEQGGHGQTARDAAAENEERHDSQDR